MEWKIRKIKDNSATCTTILKRALWNGALK